MKPILLKNKQRQRRLLSMRARLRQNSDRPRLSVERSSKHISVQVIDDVAGRTLCAATTRSKALQDQLGGKTKTERAQVVGAEIARRALDAGVTNVVFDRGAHKYHGRIKALADAAREAGLKF